MPEALRRLVPPGTEYLGEDATYWYYAVPGPASGELGGFFDGIGKMFKRMVKITPSSFKPKNIYKAVVNTALTVSTAGLYQVLPKKAREAVYKFGTVAVPVVAGAALAYTAGPAVWSVLQPKLAAAGTFLGKHASTIGGKLFDFLAKVPQSQQAAIAEQLTPEQIAEMERNQSLPPSLVPMFQQAAETSYPPPGETTGAASLYAPQPTAPVEAGMNTNVMLLIGGSLVLFFVMGQPGPAPRGRR
jgi:hypothetical protein